MSTTKRLRAPLIIMFGVMTALVTFAGPANAADSVLYPPKAGTQVLGAGAGTNVQAAGTTAATSAATSAATGGLAFTGANAIGVGALGGLLLVGGGAMVLTGRRRKDNA
jgi:hypothetical protein